MRRGGVKVCGRKMIGCLGWDCTTLNRQHHPVCIYSSCIFCNKENCVLLRKSSLIDCNCIPFNGLCVCMVPVYRQKKNIRLTQILSKTSTECVNFPTAFHLNDLWASVVFIKDEYLLKHCILYTQNNVIFPFF